MSMRKSIFAGVCLAALLSLPMIAAAAGGGASSESCPGVAVLVKCFDCGLHQYMGNTAVVGEYNASNDSCVNGFATERACYNAYGQKKYLGYKASYVLGGKIYEIQSVLNIYDPSCLDSH